MSHLPKFELSLKTSMLTKGMVCSEHDLMALAFEVGSLNARGWIESISSVLSQISLAIEVFLT